jgi:hypothetical protein
VEAIKSDFAPLLKELVLDLFLTPGRVASSVNNRSTGGWKMYVTDEACSKWVEFGGRGRLKPANGLPKQKTRGYDTLAEVWQFVRDISADDPDVIERIAAYHNLYSIKQNRFTGEFRQDLRNPPDKGDCGNETDLFVESRDVTSCMQPTRPGQQEFRKAVIERYGACCAFCRITHEALLDAAHIIPWSLMGADHPENGIVLCKLHHRALDQGLVHINPFTLQLHYVGNGPQAADLHIERDDIKHLSQLPRAAALQNQRI